MNPEAEINLPQHTHTESEGILILLDPTGKWVVWFDILTKQIKIWQTHGPVPGRWEWSGKLNWRRIWKKQKQKTNRKLWLWSNQRLLSNYHMLALVGLPAMCQNARRIQQATANISLCFMKYLKATQRRINPDAFSRNEF